MHPLLRDYRTYILALGPVATGLVTLQTARILGVVQPDPTPTVAYYDLNTAEVFYADLQPPPIAAPSGPLPTGEHAGVILRRVGVGGCGPEHRVITVLETLHPLSRPRDDAPAVPADRSAYGPVVPVGLLGKQPDDHHWQPGFSLETVYANLSEELDLNTVLDCTP